MEAAQNQWLSTAQSVLSVSFWLLTAFLYQSARIIYRALYILMVPLMYPLYYIFTVVVFLLSPVWIVVKMFSSMALWTAGLAAKLKVSNSPVSIPLCPLGHWDPSVDWMCV